MLTEKQAAVLGLLAKSLTSKEIAAKLGTSESAVNRHIEILRSRFGGITRAQLAQRYRERPSDFHQIVGAAACVEPTKQIIDLAETPRGTEGEPQDDPKAGLAFKDSLEMTIDAPWTRPEEQRVVPRVLDGDNAALTRGAAIAIILFALIASLILGLAAAQAITEALGS
ncbi:response regulator transcription factor [Sphingopyxis panaciterrulae]|uniref:DNA-binding CsgD family transcriptional regulator n=1 Tax=Sphingopyxis panaciterrulae TaxID=462372 RepID=A0A7W9B976_9SPHN|nr:helix-turn-helix domain-containing protein [Sphingopyxis panaciterrulae]MBB5708587.1 DNA-binding CsgD family transcriptional regulator [Sphingopyxis panaciterrulae]